MHAFRIGWSPDLFAERMSHIRDIACFPKQNHVVRFMRVIILPFIEKAFELLPEGRIGLTK